MTWVFGLCVYPPGVKEHKLDLHRKVTDRRRVFVTVPAQADRRHFASTLALDCGLKNKSFILYFVVLLVIAIIFPLKPD